MPRTAGIAFRPRLPRRWAATSSDESPGIPAFEIEAITYLESQGDAKAASPSGPRRTARTCKNPRQPLLACLEAHFDTRHDLHIPGSRKTYIAHPGPSRCERTLPGRNHRRNRFGDAGDGTPPTCRRVRKPSKPHQATCGTSVLSFTRL